METKYNEGDIVAFHGWREHQDNVITKGRILKYIEQEIESFFGKKYIKKYYLIENLDSYHCGDWGVSGNIVKIDIDKVYYKVK